MYPFIDKEKCCECRVCVDVCPYEVFGVAEDGKVRVEAPESCIECGECIRNCSNDAITLVE